MDHDPVHCDRVYTLAQSRLAIARSGRSAQDCLTYIEITLERVRKSEVVLARSDRLIAQLYDLAYRPSGNWYQPRAACSLSSPASQNPQASDSREH